MNILVFTKNWIGDVIFETAAIKVLKENFREAHLVCVTPPRCADILRANPYVNEVICFDEKGSDRSIFRQLQLVFKLRQRKFDQAYLFHRSSTRARIAFLAGIKTRIGYNAKAGFNFLSHAIPEPAQSVHDVQYFVDLLRATGLHSKGDYQYEFYFSKEDERKAELLIQKNGLSERQIVALNPGANWAPKRWPAINFRKLAQTLVHEYGVQIVVTGSLEDVPIVHEVVSGNEHLPIISLCGEMTLCELGAFYSKCELVISNDSGPLHVAAGVGANVIGIFGPTAPLETAPMGRGRNIVIDYAPDGVKRPWIGKKFPGNWMEQITVDHVLGVVKQEGLLDERQAPLTHSR